MCVGTETHEKIIIYNKRNDLLKWSLLFCLQSSLLCMGKTIPKRVMDPRHAKDIKLK